MAAPKHAPPQASPVAVHDKPSLIPTVPWHPFVGVIVLLVIFYSSQIIAGLGIGLYGTAIGKNSKQLSDWINNSVSAQFFFILAAEALSIAAIYFFVRYYKQTLSLIGLKRPRLKDFGVGLLAAPVYFVFYIFAVGIVGALVPALNVNQTQEIGFTNVHGSVALIMTFISLAILPPLAEEIMVRGFLYSSLRKGLPYIWAVLVTSALFAAAHLPEGGAAGPLYIAALDTFILSLFLIYLREKTGSLWASITLHAIKNSVAFAALFIFHAH